MRQVRSISALLVVVLLMSCANVPLHPGAVNKTDSVAYDTLTIAQAVIEQSRSERAGGNLPDNMVDPLNTLVNSYNTARDAWLLYRAAIKAHTPADVAGLQAKMNTLSTSLGNFNKLRSIQ